MSALSFDIQADAEAAARSAAERLAAVARGGGHVALSGGSTPARAYELAARSSRLEPRARLVGRRALRPAGRRALELPAREGDAARPRSRRSRRCTASAASSAPAAAADAYDAELEGVALDLALYGIGPDGHTASLFPDAPRLDERDRRAVAAPAGLEPFVERVTMTIPVLARGALGASSSSRARTRPRPSARAFAGAPDPATPASLVRSERRDDAWSILDRAAASPAGHRAAERL